jgi:hypothetical protein
MISSDAGMGRGGLVHGMGAVRGNISDAGRFGLRIASTRCREIRK